ncbi:Gp37-like protein [Streptomyces sp. INA 01156]
MAGRRQRPESLGPAGRLIWSELNQALGSGALANRRIGNVIIGDEVVFGREVSDNVQWDVIGAKLESWIDTTTAGYRFVWDPNEKVINLHIYTPRDLSKNVRFSTDLGNLREFTWSLTAPTVTRVIVACQGSGKNRYLYQQIDHESEEEWGIQVEQFLDRRDLPIKAPDHGSPRQGGLVCDGRAVRHGSASRQGRCHRGSVSGRQNGNFQIYPVDTPLVKFGRDYFVGDLVTIAIDGTEYVDIVREVSITVDQGGQTETVSPTIGNRVRATRSTFTRQYSKCVKSCAS